MNFNLKAEYTPGKNSGCCGHAIQEPAARHGAQQRQTHRCECYFAAVMRSVPASPMKMDGIQAETVFNEQLQGVIRYIKNGWPEYITHTHTDVREYFPVKNELSVHEVLVNRGSWIVIPEMMRSVILEQIHDGQ